MSQQSFLSLGPHGFHRVAYTDWGDPANPRVVVCVHGLARNSRDFDRLAAVLARDFRVVCMDVVGRGDSDWLDDKSGYSFATYLGDAAALVARITTPVRKSMLGGLQARLLGRAGPTRLHWVGTSMGGLIGMLLAAKTGSPIRRLVLNDVGPFVPWDALVRLKGYVGRQTRFDTLDEVERYVREVCASFGPLDDEHWRHLAKYSVRQDEGSGWILHYDPDISRGLPMHRDRELPIGPDFMRGIDLWNAWSSVQVPTLVLRGAESDVLRRQTVEEMARRKRNLRVREFPGVGHAPALGDPDQIQAVRDFLMAPEEDLEEQDVEEANE